MATRFRKSKTIAPGVKLNLSKKSVGVSLGGKGLHYSVNSSGRKTVSAGIPGSGISFVKSSGGSSNANRSTTSLSGTENIHSSDGSYTKNGYTFEDSGVIFPNKVQPVPISRIKTNKTIFLVFGILFVLLSLPILPIGFIFMIFGIVFLFMAHSSSNLIKSYNVYKSTQIMN
jgi:hypothetical protein